MKYNGSCPGTLETSYNAAVDTEVSGRADIDRARILDFITAQGAWGATDDEMMAVMRVGQDGEMAHGSLNVRRIELWERLVICPFVGKDGCYYQRQTRKDKPANVWITVVLARQLGLKVVKKRIKVIIACPDCGANISSAEPTPDGLAVRCTRCDCVFTINVAVVSPGLPKMVRKGKPA